MSKQSLYCVQRGARARYLVSGVARYRIVFVGEEALSRVIAPMLRTLGRIPPRARRMRRSRSRSASPPPPLPIRY